MGIKSRFKRFFELEDQIHEVDEIVDDRSYEDERMTAHANTGQERAQQNIVSLQSVQNSAKMILMEPRTYDEAQDIADHLKARKAVVINLQRISHEQAKRVVDFVSGTVYAIGGDIQKLGSNIFLCTPDNVDVSGTITEMMQEQYQS